MSESAAPAESRLTKDLTKNQATVLAVLKEARRPLSAYQIMDHTAGEGVRAPPQVYRALEKLIEFRLVHRIETLNAYLACDHGPHVEQVAFAICEHCGQVTEVPMKAILPALDQAAEHAGFHVHAAQVEMQGLCRACSHHHTHG